MRTIRLFIVFVTVFSGMLPARGEIRRDPNGVNVNSQGATTVFITFGGLQDQVPVEALWCGELISAAPDIGQKCAPGTIFGQLPLRYDQSRLSGPVFTDIMSIPSNVVRRAYQAAEAGQSSSFFYVRRFVRLSGGPDEYVFVTCRLAGIGARTPLALTDVRIRFEIETPVLVVRPGEAAPPLFAEIAYNGSGVLKGRWEVVLPGQQLPTENDLLTEASLPPDLRGTQQRYTLLERFQQFVPPTGRIRIPGPAPEKLPTATEGLYLVLLRVEASDDKEGDSNLAAAGAGKGVIHNGGVAGFPLPPLRYYVSSSGTVIGAEGSGRLQLLEPPSNALAALGTALTFTWDEGVEAPYNRIDVEDASETPIVSAILPRGIRRYEAPSWFREKATPGRLRWRVVALNPDGEVMGSTPWRPLNYAPAEK